MDLIAGHCELTVAGKWRQFVEGGCTKKEGDVERGEQQRDYTSSFFP